jgi:hypothetical protein
VKAKKGNRCTAPIFMAARPGLVSRVSADIGPA